MRIRGRSASIAFALFAMVFGQVPAGEVPRFAKDLPDRTSGSPEFSFNGKDLTGFYTYSRAHQYRDPNRVFTVQDGMIRISGREDGGLITRESYSNYHLVAEWKWGDQTWYPHRYQARNSGILVHSVGPDGDAVGFLMAAIECQIIEGGTGDLLVVPGKKEKDLSLTSEVRIGADGQPYYQKGGTSQTRKQGRFNWWGRDPGWKDVLRFRGEDDVEKPAGQWNRMEVICDGDTITCILNETVVNAGTRASPASGKIQFESEGSEIFFRKVEIRPLVGKTLPPSETRKPSSTAVR